MADRPDADTGVDIVTGSAGDRAHVVVVGYANQDVLAVAAALLGDRAGEPVHATSDEAPAKVLSAVHEYATRADLLVVYLSGVLSIAGKGTSPKLALVDPRQRRMTTPMLDVAEVLTNAKGAKAHAVVVDGVVNRDAFDATALRKWVAGNDKSTYLLIGTGRPDGPGQTEHLMRFVRPLGDVLAGRGPGPGRRDRVTPADPGNGTEQHEEARLVAHVGAKVAAELPAPGPGRPRRPPRKARPWTPRWEVRSWQRRTKIAVATACVLVLLGVLAIVALPLGSAPDPEAVCEPPLELRVLSSPEGYPAFRDAATTFADRQRDANGCRLIHPTVYPATTDAALRGFSQAAGWARPATGPARGGAGVPCPGVGGSPADRDEPAAGVMPGRDIGPRPDVWFPDSTSDVDRAKCAAPASAVGFGEVTSVAWSPLVLGVFQPVGDQYFPGEDDWASLTEKVTAADLDLVRPNPATSSAGLLHTVSLYEALDDVPALERGMTTDTLPLSDSVDLLCHLASVSYPNQGPAVLVSETSLVNYNLGTLPDCPDGARPRSDTALQAHYPPDTPALDHPFVDLTWTDEPGSRARTDAVAAFRQWLLSDDGQRTLAGAGLRPVRNVTADPDHDLLGRPGSGARRERPAHAGQPELPRVRAVLESYAEAHEAGQVAFLVDVSLSMAANGSLEAAKGLIGTSVSLMGDKDLGALTTVPRTTEDSAELHAVVPLGTPSSGTRIRAGLGGVTAQRNGVALYDAIDQQLALLAATPGPAKQTLVVLTGGEDSYRGRGLSGQSADELIGRYQATRRATVQVVAFSPATCGGDLGRLAAALGGQCISSVDNSTPAAVVAGVWQGSGDA
jgi:hypothetical protein